MTSTRTGSLYGSDVTGNGGKGLQTYHYLWMLVAIEIGFLILLRTFVFRRYHGG